MLLSNLNLLATAPGGVARLRELILTLAVQGKLVAQDPTDEPASELLKKIRAEKDRLIAEGKIKRDKALAAIVEGEKPFEVPGGWEWVKLGVATKKITDGTHHSPVNLSSGDFLYLSAKNIKPWGIDLSNVTYVPAAVHQEIYARCDPEFGDILYIKDGATTGVLTINSLREQFSLLSSVGVLKPSCGLSSPYLALVMGSPFFYQAIRDGMTGVAITRVTLSKLGIAVIPLPPLAEQARIVTRVEELMRLCDALEAKGQLEAKQHSQLVSTLFDTLLQSPTPEVLAQNWQRVATHFDLLLDRPQAVDALEQTILQLAVRGLLVPQDPTDEPASQLLQTIRQEKDRLILEGKIKRDKPLPPIATDEQPFELPQGWAWARWGQVTSRVQYGYTASADNTISEPKFVRITDIQNDQVNWGTVPGVPDARDLSGYLLEDGDLLIARTGGTIGKSFLVRPVPLKAVFASYLIRVSAVAGLMPDYLKIFASSAHYWEQLIARSMGTGQPNVNGTALSELVMLLPPLPEQSRIVARVEALRRLCADLRQRLSHSQTVQAQLAESLLASVVA